MKTKIYQHFLFATCEKKLIHFNSSFVYHYQASLIIIFPLAETVYTFITKTPPNKMLGGDIIIKPLALFTLGHTFLLLFLQNQILERLQLH